MKKILAAFAIFLLAWLSGCSTQTPVNTDTPPSIVQVAKLIETKQYDTATELLKNILDTKPSTLVSEFAYVNLAYCYEMQKNATLVQYTLQDGYEKTGGEHIKLILDNKIPLHPSSILLSYANNTLFFEYLADSKVYLRAEQYHDSTQKLMYYDTSQEVASRIIKIDGIARFEVTEYSKNLNKYVPTFSRILENDIFKEIYYTENGDVKNIIYSEAIDGGEKVKVYLPSGKLSHEQIIYPDKLIHRQFDDNEELLFERVEFKENDKDILEIYSDTGKLMSRTETVTDGEKTISKLFDAQGAPVLSRTTLGGTLISEQVYYDADDGSGLQLRYSFDEDGTVKTEKYSDTGKLSTYTLEYTKDNKKFIEFREADGKLASTNVFKKNENGSWTDVSFKPDGTLQREQLGEADGTVQEKLYYDDGTLSETGIYKNTEHTIQRFSEGGLITYFEYYSKTTNTREVKLFYKNGSLKSHSITDPTGNTVTEYRPDKSIQSISQNYKNGKHQENYYTPNGVLVFSTTGDALMQTATHYLDGFVQKKHNIVFSTIDGAWKYSYFDSNGTEIDEKTYKAIKSEYDKLKSSDEILNKSATY